MRSNVLKFTGSKTPHAPTKRGKSPKSSPLVAAFRTEVEAEQRGVVAAAYEKAMAGDDASSQGLYHYAQGLARSIEVLESVAECIASKPLA